MENINTKIKLTDQPWSTCDCGHRMFENGIIAKRISALISPTGQEDIYPIDVLYCTSCKKVPSFIYSKFPDFPEELKAQKAVKLNLE